MMNRALSCLLLFFVAGLLSGCLASLQPAQTLPEGAYRIHAGVEYFADSVPSTTGSTSSSSTAIDTKTRTTLNVGIRFGVDRNVDLGFQVSLPTISLDFPHLLLDLKYMYVHSGKFSASLGLGVGFLSAKLTTDRASTLDIQGNAYFGYDFGRRFGMFLNLRSLSPVVLTTGGASSISAGTLGTGTLGFRIGDTFGLVAGGTYARSFSGGSDTILIGAALFVGSRSYFGPGAETSDRLEQWRERQIEKRPKGAVTGRTRPTAGVSRVLKVRASDNLALLSHPESGRWKVGETLCVSKADQKIACGKVTKSDDTGAVLKYSNPSGSITPGMDATLENGDVRYRGEPEPESDPEPILDPDAEPSASPAAQTPEDNADLNDPVLGLP